MNVQEQLLAERIDPHLTKEHLAGLVSDRLGERVEVISTRVLTGGCRNRVLELFSRAARMPVPEPLLLSDTGDPIPGTVLMMNLVHLEERLPS